jgi:Mn-dependent DtxR family transcriptional regulator
MVERIHIAVDAADKQRFRRLAEREGKSLSGWLRDTAREKAEAAEARVRLETEQQLRSFFEACDRRERGREPDWEQHRRMIERSAASGAAET